MNTFLELSKSRRSIRSYEKREIKQTELEKCAEAARYAPSACNTQPWKFIIVNTVPVRKKIAEEAFSSFNSFAKEAAAYIIIVSEKTNFSAWLGEKLRSTDFRLMDIGSAASHIALQAQELGIGSCILGWFDEKKIKKILKVPFSKKIELVIALGYQKNTSETPPKKLKDASDAVSFNRY